MTRDDALPQQEMDKQRDGSAKFDVVALVPEACEALKVKIEEEDRSDTRSDSRDSKLVGFSNQTDGAYGEAESWYDKERLTEDKVEIGELAITSLEKD